MDEHAHRHLLYEILDPSFLRLGPGDDASTPRHMRVLDIGCGTGSQTLQLARHLDGTIVAIDDHRSYLDELERRARAAGLAEKITPRLKDMQTLGDEDGVFDLVWAEGSLFVMGFRPGIEACFARLILSPARSSPRRASRHVLHRFRAAGDGGVDPD